MKVEIKADFPEAQRANIEIDYPKKIEVVIESEIPNNLTSVPEGAVRFFVTQEPDGAHNELILNNRHCFTYLLTKFPELLTLPSARLFVGCGSFVDPDPDIKKKFAVSTVFTGRDSFPGHKLRHELWRRRDEIKIPFDIYTGQWHGITTDDPSVKVLAWPDRKDKIRTFDCMFQIVIDAFKIANQISEKLIDPLITKTIPIYYGCINLSDYFNPYGIIEINSVDEIIRETNLLTPEFYYNSLDAVNENYYRAIKCYKYEDILRDAIVKTLKTDYYPQFEER
jgi:hypothetical protein